MNNVEKLALSADIHQPLTRLDVTAERLAQSGAIGYDVALLRQYRAARAEVERVLLEMLNRA